jgi:hypothetical protein
MTLKLTDAWNERIRLWAEGGKLRAEGDKLRAECDKLWAEGNKLWAEGNKLWAEGYKLRAEGDKLWAEGDKLWAEGDKLWAEGDKLRAEGALVWINAVLKAYGDVTLSWTWSTAHGVCTLENGDVYGLPDAAAERERERNHREHEAYLVEEHIAAHGVRGYKEEM